MSDTTWPRPGREWEEYLAMTPEQRTLRELQELRKWSSPALTEKPLANNVYNREQVIQVYANDTTGL